MEAFATFSVKQHVQALVGVQGSVEQLATALHARDEREAAVQEQVQSLPAEVACHATGAGVVLPSASSLSAALHVRRMRRALFRAVPREIAREFVARFDAQWRVPGVAGRVGVQASGEEVREGEGPASTSRRVGASRGSRPSSAPASSSITLIGKWVIAALLNGPTPLSTLHDQVHVAAKYARTRLTQVDVSTGIELLGLLGLLAVQQGGVKPNMEGGALKCLRVPTGDSDGGSGSEGGSRCSSGGAAHPLSPAHASDGPEDPIEGDLVTALSSPGTSNARLVALDAEGGEGLALLDTSLPAPLLPASARCKSRRPGTPSPKEAMAVGPTVLLNLSRVPDVVACLGLPLEDAGVRAAMDAATAAAGGSKALPPTPPPLPTLPASAGDLDTLLSAALCPSGAIVSPLTAHLWTTPPPMGSPHSLPSAAPNAPRLPSVAAVGDALAAAEARYAAGVEAGVAWLVGSGHLPAVRAALPSSSPLTVAPDPHLARQVVRTLVPPFDRPSLVSRLVGHSTSSLARGKALLGAVVADTHAAATLRQAPDPTSTPLTLEGMLGRFQTGIDPLEPPGSSVGGEPGTPPAGTPSSPASPSPSSPAGEDKLAAVAAMALAATKEGAGGGSDAVPSPLPVALSLLRASSSEDLVSLAAAATRGGAPLTASSTGGVPGSPGFAPRPPSAFSPPAAPTLPEAPPAGGAPCIMVEPLDAGAAATFARAVATRAKVASASLEGGLVMLWVPPHLTPTGRPRRLMYVPPELSPEEVTEDQALHRALLADAMARQEGGATAPPPPLPTPAVASDPAPSPPPALPTFPAPAPGVATVAGEGGAMSDTLVFAPLPTTSPAPLPSAPRTSHLMAVSLQPYHPSKRATQVEATALKDASDTVQQAAQQVAGWSPTSTASSPPPPTAPPPPSSAPLPAGGGGDEARVAPQGRTMLDVYTPVFRDLGPTAVTGGAGAPVPPWSAVASAPVDVASMREEERGSPCPSPLTPAAPASAMAAAAAMASAAAGETAEGEGQDAPPPSPSTAPAAPGAPATPAPPKRFSGLNPPLDNLRGGPLPTINVPRPGGGHWQRPQTAWDTFPQRQAELTAAKAQYTALPPSPPAVEGGGGAAAPSPLKPLRITVRAGARVGRYPLSRLNWYYDDGCHDEWVAGGVASPDLRDATFAVKHDAVNVALKARMAEVTQRMAQRKRGRPPPKARAPLPVHLMTRAERIAAGGSPSPLPGPPPTRGTKRGLSSADAAPPSPPKRRRSDSG